MSSVEVAVQEIMDCESQNPKNTPISQLHSIRGKRCDSLCSEKSTSYHYVAAKRTKQLHALLRIMHAFEISINIKSRQVMFLDEFQKN